MIRIDFPTAADSPTGQTPVRIRFRMERRGGATVPVLTYQHGAAELTREAWAGFQAAGATIAAESDRERAIVAEALGDQAMEDLRS